MQKQTQSSRYLITQIRKVDDINDLSISECLSLIRNMFDLKIQSDCRQIIAIGLPTVLLEVIFKINIINDQCRLDAFQYYRDLIQNEWQHKDITLPEDQQMQTLRFIKLLPKPIFELFTDDSDEVVILSNLSREWNTPNLLWTIEMIKETLLIFVEYNNQLLAQQIIEYSIIQPISQLIYPQIANEVTIDHIILKEYNTQPSWLLEGGLLAFLNQCIEHINPLLTQYLTMDQTTIDYDRLSCKLLTCLTSFQLALEQYFFNHTHPEFEQDLQLLEEYNQEQINQLLNLQRDAISINIVNQIITWMDLLELEKQVHLYIRSMLVQAFYTLVHSEVAVVLLQQNNLHSRVFSIVQNILWGNYHRNDKCLAISILFQVLQYKFIIIKLEQAQFIQLYAIYNLIRQEQYSMPYYLNIISIIQQHPTQSIEWTKFLVESNYTLNAADLKVFENKDRVPTLQQWRNNFDDSAYQMQRWEDIEDGKYNSNILYPIISKIAIDPLPHMSDKLIDRMEQIRSRYEQYIETLQDGKFNSIKLDTADIQIPVIPKPIQQSRESERIVVDEDEIFS